MRVEFGAAYVNGARSMVVARQRASESEARGASRASAARAARAARAPISPSRGGCGCSGWPRSYSLLYWSAVQSCAVASVPRRACSVECWDQLRWGCDEIADTRRYDNDSPLSLSCDANRNPAGSPPLTRRELGGKDFARRRHTRAKMR